MSPALINRSNDLRRLRQEGYELEVVDGFLLVHHVPYVTNAREVKFGVLVSSLCLAGDQTTKPDNHVAHFIGEQPCDRHGVVIAAIQNAQKRRMLGPGVTIDRSFSSKPRRSGYVDYHEKISTYVRILSGPAQSIDPNVAAQTFLVPERDSSSVFNYQDTATARAEIGAVTDRLRGHRIGIIGLGGTGSYVLDLVAKTPVAEIHMFDSDVFHQHSSFRAPAAASLETLRALPLKVDYFHEMYSAMRGGLFPHPVRVDRSNAAPLERLDFVFVCVDDGASRAELVEILYELEKPFIDVGIGVELIDERAELTAHARVSISTPSNRDGEARIPTARPNRDDIYDRNIQIADLNCLNASLAVIRWKRFCGFYQDQENEHTTLYVVAANQLESVVE